MKWPALLLPFALISLSLCGCKKVTVERPTEEEPSVEAQAEVQPADQDEVTKAQIAELEREIQSSMQIIDDLQAAVVMEQAKLQDDPNYDQSFLQETLAEQESERKDIKEAQKRLDALTGSAE